MFGFSKCVQYSVPRKSIKNVTEKMRYLNAGTRFFPVCFLLLLLCFFLLAAPYVFSIKNTSEFEIFDGERQLLFYNTIFKLSGKNPVQLHSLRKNVLGISIKTMSFVIESLIVIIKVIFYYYFIIELNSVMLNKINFYMYTIYIIHITLYKVYIYIYINRYIYAQYINRYKTYMQKKTTLE